MNSKVTLVFLAVAVAMGSALKCHVCNSSEQRKCEDPFVYEDSGQPVTREFEADCDEVMKGTNKPNGTEWKYCRKIYQNVRDDERIIRTCGWEDDEKERECYKTVLEEYNTYVCSCTEDYCNGAEPRLGWSVMFALLPAAIVLQLLK